MIRSGDADAVVCGGAEATLTPIAIAAFSAMAATSQTGISRPFDARRDGFVMGEGAGALVLEEAEAAERRGATILGEILGYAATSDAHHLTAPDPEGHEAARAITLALGDAGIGADDVDYVNAHGTSTPLNDRSETEALKSALGKRASEIPVSSTKSAIGHLLGAAGAVEAVATAGALAQRRRPADPRLLGARRGPGPGLRPQRGARRWRRRPATAGGSRSPTRSALAATTRSSASAHESGCHSPPDRGPSRAAARRHARAG